MGGKKSHRARKRTKTFNKMRNSKNNNIKKVEEPFFDCKVCKKRFRQESTYQLHTLIHKREQAFSCNICKEEFPFLSRLQKHCLLEHSNDLLVVGQESEQVGSKKNKPFTCEICGNGFSVNYALEKHLSCVHKKKCKCCDKELSQCLTSPKISNKSKPVVISNDCNSKNDIAPVSRQTESGSAELYIKKESDTSCDNRFDSEISGVALKNEGSSSCNKRNHATRSKCQDFSKNDLSQVHVKPDKSADFFIKVEADRFDPEEASDPSWSEGSSSYDEESDESSGSFDERVKPKNKYSCPLCNKKFVKNCYLQGHLNTHQPKPANYTPRFTSDQPLSSQPSGALSVLNIGPYICETCHKRFVKNEDFQKHCLTHSEQNTYTCKVCNKQFARYGNFKAHCETHVKKNTFSCDICGTNFNFQKHLIDHQQLQSANAKLQCDFCNQKFDQACSLIIHEQTHRGYHCEDCGSVFSTAAALKRHLRSHPNKNKCEVCAETFTTSSLYRQHLETHSSLKQYRCEVCDEGFEFKHHLRIHRTTHQGEMPHTCQLCNEGFSYAWSLRNHLLEHEVNQDGEMWQNSSPTTGEHVENMESSKKVAFNEMSISYEEEIEINIKKEKDS